MKQKLIKSGLAILLTLVLKLLAFTQVQYSTISEDEFYFPSFADNILFSFVFGDTSVYQTETTNYNWYFFPYCWKKVHNGYGLFSGYGYNSSIFRYQFEIYPHNKLDATEIKEREQFLIDSITPIVGSTEKGRLWYLLHEQDKIKKEKFLPLDQWLSSYLLRSREQFFKEALPYVSFDFVQLLNDEYLVYIRNRHELTQWRFNFIDSDEYQSSTWVEVITYSQLGEPFLPYRAPYNSILPKGDKHVYQAIPDSLFFVGEYKVIRQDTTNFIINTSHGAIYYQAPEQIVKVGQIRDFENYPIQWFIKTDDALFIEDQDRGTLIFFKEVDQTNTDYPFPKIVILRDKASARKRFGALIRP